MIVFPSTAMRIKLAGCVRPGKALIGSREVARFSHGRRQWAAYSFAMLVSVPCVVLFLTVNPLPDSPHLKLLQIPAVYGAVWALVSLWVALDSAKLFQHPRAASGPSRVVWHLGIAIGSAERRSFPARSYLAHLALTNIIRASIVSTFENACVSSCARHPRSSALLDWYGASPHR